MGRARSGWLVAAVVAVVVLAATVVVAQRRDRRPVTAGAGRATAASSPTTTADAGTTAVAAGIATTSTTPSTSPPAGPGRPLEGRTVALDPGHNGRNASAPKEINRLVDAGGFQKACNTTGTATDAGVSESAVNLAIALEVRSRLQGLGATVVLTRQDDRGVGPCIDERAAVANRAKAELLLSIHADGAPAGASGFHVIRPGLVPGHTDDIAGPSSSLATAVRDALVSGGLRPSTYAGREGLVTRTDLGTLNRSDVPACMVELGNLRNQTEAATLTSAAGQSRVASGLVAGIVSWLARPAGERTGPAPPGSSTPGTTRE